MPNNQKISINTFAPILSEVVSINNLIKNRELFSKESYSTMIKTNSLRLATNAITIPATLFATATLTRDVLNNNSTLSLTELALGAGVAVTGIILSKIKSSKYQETVKRVQNELSKDFRVKFDLKTFEDLATGDNFAEMTFSNQLLNAAPGIGVNNFVKACNRWINMGTKHCFEYMKAKLIDKNENLIEDLDRLYKKTASGFVEDLYDIKSDYNDEKIEIKKQDGSIVKTTLLEKYINDNIPKKLSEKVIMEELNGSAIVAGYEKTLIQDTQLAFVNLLRLYAKERLGVPLKNDTKFKEYEERMVKYEKQINKFANLYTDTSSKSGKDIPEYKAIEISARKIKDYDSFNILSAINNESFEETVQKLNGNLSNGKHLYLRTLKDNILQARNNIMLNKREEEIEQEYVSKSSPIRKTKVEFVDDDDFIAQLGASKLSTKEEEYKKDRLKNRFK